MGRLWFVAIALALGSGLAFAQAAAPARPAVTSADPIAPVKRFYDEAVKENALPYSTRLAGLYRAARKAAEKEGLVSGLDFDPTTDSQDPEDGYRRTVRYQLLAKTDKAAEVTVTLKSSRPLELRYHLVLEKGAWRVDDIRKPAAKGQEGWSIAELLKLGAKGQ